MNQIDYSVEAIDQLLSMPMPSETIEAEKEKIRQLLFKVGIALLVNVVILILVALKDPPLSGKILLLELMLPTSVVCLAIAYYANPIVDKLQEMELLADLARDQAFVELATIRENMESLRARFVHDEHVLRSSSALPDLLKSIGPLAMLLLKKETSAVQWGMVGWKVAQNAMTFFKERSRKTAP
jgi:hypothetical protein